MQGHLAAGTVELTCRHGGAANVLAGHSLGCWVAPEAYRQDPSRGARVAYCLERLAHLSAPYI
jgi:hypothetical protein